ncbi:sigma-70 family RNA polymerase sigma factor [Paraflavitalea soli]|uniref:Sigma-70 family RNA polymerase sigma factor n=1 Tax=Paraflavitalea soli TaxID=2315862 RepID=A0A3B7MSZ5_9BACT|nr:sigma-70 family RNA polymerase sigma factor [Paraflavitalea soli]AXY73631.1 sigma-70 family RNA polymerase sigma factor [Paraflavitalea soli]
MAAALHHEQELLVRLKQGDESAFTALYSTYWKPLYFLAYKHLQSAATAEELVQEVFLTLWEKRASLTIHSPAMYLAAMIRYAVYRHIAREKKHPLLPAGEGSTVQLASEEALHTIDHKLLFDMVAKLSDRLPEKCRMVFISNKLLDQPIQEIAEQMNISTRTAEAHLSKALKIMRSHLGNASSLLLLF